MSKPLGRRVKIFSRHQCIVWGDQREQAIQAVFTALESEVNTWLMQNPDLCFVEQEFKFQKGYRNAVPRSCCTSGGRL